MKTPPYIGSNRAAPKPPRSKTLLKLYTQVLSQKGDWPAIAALLPELTKHKAMDETALHLLEETTLAALISSAAQTGLEALQNAWAGLNKAKTGAEPPAGLRPRPAKTQSRRTRRTPYPQGPQSCIQRPWPRSTAT